MNPLISFGTGSGPDPVRAAAQRVREWAEDLLEGTNMQDDVVSVAQVRCYEPGCAPIETVISIMARPPLVVKVLKPVAETSEADVRAILVCQSRITALDGSIIGVDSAVAPGHSARASDAAQPSVAAQPPGADAAAAADVLHTVACSCAQCTFQDKEHKRGEKTRKTGKYWIY
jgi:hypothetical protein